MYLQDFAKHCVQNDLLCELLFYLDTKNSKMSQSQLLRVYLLQESPLRLNLKNSDLKSTEFFKPVVGKLHDHNVISHIMAAKESQKKLIQTAMSLTSALLGSIGLSKFDINESLKKNNTEPGSPGYIRLGTWDGNIQRTLVNRILDSGFDLSLHLIRSYSLRQKARVQRQLVDYISVEGRPESMYDSYMYNTNSACSSRDSKASSTSNSSLHSSSSFVTIVATEITEYSPQPLEDKPTFDSNSNVFEPNIVISKNQDSKYELQKEQSYT